MEGLLVLLWLWLMINAPALIVLACTLPERVSTIKEEGLFGRHIIYGILFSPALLFVLLTYGIVMACCFVWEVRLFKGKDSK